MHKPKSNRRGNLALLFAAVVAFRATPLCAAAEGSTEIQVGSPVVEKRPRTAIEKLTEIERPVQPPIRFETWPEPPIGRPAPTYSELPEIPPVEMPPGVDVKKLYSFRAENLDLKTALALFARANNLNIVPDLDVTGQITLDVADLPLNRMLQALLEAHDFAWTIEDGLIRVHAHQSRSFVVDYLRMVRTGVGTSSAQLSSGTGGGQGGSGGSGSGGGGFGGGGGGGGGFGGGGAGGGGMGGQGGGAGSTMSGSAVQLSQNNPVDFWKELESELGKLLTDYGKANLAVNKTAGIIDVTDKPSAIKRVGRYLARLNSNVQRQVEIEAKLYDVTLGDQFQFGVDWEQIARAYGGDFRVIGKPTITSPAGGIPLRDNAFAMIFSNKNTSVAVTALKEQGDVTVLSQPRLRTLNNQTALIKVGTDTPFFSQNVYFLPTAFGASTTTVEESNYELITIGTILSITPQISSNNSITLDVSPTITSLVDTKIGRNGTTAPVIDIKQASSLVKVNDGETVILGGLIQNSSSKSTRKIPVIGDIPWFGELFTGHVNAKQKKELVIFLTPRIVH